MPKYDLPRGVIMTPTLGASMAFYPLDLQGLIRNAIELFLKKCVGSPYLFKYVGLFQNGPILYLKKNSFREKGKSLSPSPDNLN